MMELQTVETSHGPSTYWIEPKTDGVPLIYHHGMPSAGQPNPILRNAARAAGFRLIQIVRPGYGTSSVNAGYTVADVARRSADLALSMSDRFAVIGLSAGGPFSLATAAAGGDRVIGAGVIAGLGPLREDIFETEEERAEVEQYIALTQDRAQVIAALQPEVDSMLADLDAGLVDMQAKATGQDALSLTPERLKVIEDSLRWTFSVSIDGYVDDVIAVFAEWGFDLGQVRCPVSLHYGTADNVVKPMEGQAYARLLPKADLYLHQDHGHTSISAFSAPLIVEWLETLI